MMDFPILSILIAIPAIGAALVFLARNHSTAAKYIALAATLITFVVSILLLVYFDKTTAEFQFTENYPWIPDYNINYHLGIDGISVFFVILTTLLMPICILTGWEAIEKQIPLYLASFLLMESLLIGVFASLDFVLFYIFFEAVLIPMYLIIGIWGGENRVYAAFKFFLYTLIGSVLLLLALIYIYLHTRTGNSENAAGSDFACSKYINVTSAPVTAIRILKKIIKSLEVKSPWKAVMFCDQQGIIRTTATNSVRLESQVAERRKLFPSAAAESSKIAAINTRKISGRI